MSSSLRAIIDTNVVFTGLTQQGNACGLIIDTWLAGLFQPCVCNTLAVEYADVLSRKLSGERWERLKPVLGTLLRKADFALVHYTWRPASPDPGDDHLIDCAMNANAVLVTENLRDFALAKAALGIQVFSPVAFLDALLTQES
jgi:predicted nucleic acid-binding protein